MTVLLFAVLGFVVVMSLGFALAPLWRTQNLKGRSILAAAIALFLLGVGGGTYFMLGQPYLAWRTAQGVDTRDINGLIALLIKRVRQVPNDQQAWTFLARGYMGAGDAGDAAKAYARAVALANRSGRPDASLDVLYGEALVAQSNGEVGDEAEAAFRAALKLNPKDQAAPVTTQSQKCCLRVSRGNAWPYRLLRLPAPRPDSPISSRAIVQSAATMSPFDIASPARLGYVPQCPAPLSFRLR